MNGTELKRMLWACPTLALLLAVIPPVGEAQTESARSGELLVRFAPNTAKASAKNAAIAAGALDATPRYAPGYYLLRVPKDERSRDVVADNLRRNGTVDQVTPNYMGRGGYIPGDTLFGDQWHLNAESGVDIDAVNAWEVARGDARVVVAVLDSGLTLDHPEFSGRVAVSATETANGLDDDGNGLIDDINGWDFVTDDHDPGDAHGHGTWVTSVLAANADNEFGVVGVDHHARVLPVRVLDADNRGSLADLIDGIYYAIDAGAQVINLSLIDYPASVMLDDALAAADDANVTVVACAGNSGEGSADNSWPGAHPLTMSVGSTTATDKLATFSSTGASVSFAAPGQSIAAADHVAPYQSDLALMVDGCSFATPLVAGVAALLHAVRPGIDRVSVEAILAASAVDLGPQGRDSGYGWGRIDAAGALALVDRVFAADFESP